MADEIIQLRDPNKSVPELMRRVVALVEVDDQEQEMTFPTNNLGWSPRSVADLYRCRWQIEAFFKQIKQTLQLTDFLGHNANAVRWQVWMALLTYVLLRYLTYLSGWAHSFTRLFTLCGGTMGKARFAGFVAGLWDSQRQFPPLNPSGTSLFTRLHLKLWDSIRIHAKTETPQPSNQNLTFPMTL